MKRTLIHNALIVNEGICTQGSLVIEGGKIAEVLTHGKPLSAPCDDTIDATGCYLIPGVIDEHVHMREPGMTEKADISSESRAAAAGGVTSIMDMPNNNPQITSLDALDMKMGLLDEKCIVNHACYYGATNANYKDFSKLPAHRIAGIKVFMGSSTGNMLVNDVKSLLQIFTGTDRLIAAHCEDMKVINHNTKLFQSLYAQGEVPLNKHPFIRSEEACYNSTQAAITLANRTGARLHVLHLSTNHELRLFQDKPIGEKRITSEVCVPHLLFKANEYKTLGARIKCNPAVKSTVHRNALRKALAGNLIDCIATDHAPHLLSDKVGGALQATSGMPMVQFSLVAMLQLVEEGVLNIETLVQKMCHAPATLYGIERRGFIREGYQADMVLVRKGEPWVLTPNRILSKCGWSPLEGKTFDWHVDKTFINGQMVYADGQVDENYRGEALYFEK